MENEDAFAAEAQDEAIRTRRGRRELYINRQAEDQSDEDELHNDGSPLLPSKSATARTISADGDSDSYQRAVHEPWLGAIGSEELPWWRKPHVSEDRPPPPLCGSSTD